MHGFDGLALFSEDACAWEGVDVAKIERVHPPRFRQIVLLKGWHLSRTSLQRIKPTSPNNSSKMTSILAQSAGGHKPSGWVGRLQNRFSPDKMRLVDRENHILYEIDRNNPKTLPGHDGSNVSGISYLKPQEKVFGSQAGVTSHLLQGWF